MPKSNPRPTLTTVFTLATLCLLMALQGPLRGAQLEGRWLFQIALDSGQMLPAFILELPSQEGEEARLLSVQSSGPMEIDALEVSEQRIQVTLVSQAGKLTFSGQVVDDQIRGTVDGAGLQNREFVAKRTDLKELGRPQPPGQDERLTYTRALSLSDPAEKVKALNAFIRQYSRSDLVPQAYEKIFEIQLELGVPEAQAMQAARDFVVHSKNQLTALDRVAALLAGEEVFLERAEAFSDEVLAKADPKTPSMPRFLQTRAEIALLRQQPEEAVRYLQLARELDPTSGQIPLQMANAYHQAGDLERAQELYLQSFLNSGNSTARARLERFYRQAHGSSEGLDELISEAFSQRPLPFQAGRYTGPEPQKVALVELFTGSECVPCQAADYAFNGLVEHYPHEVVVPIQYHLHIPKIDPMGNPDAYERAAYYGVQSTPAAIFGGSGRHMGGGRKQRSAGLFSVYQREIREAAAEEAPEWMIEVSGHLQEDVLHYQARAKPSGESRSALRLHLALVEGTIEYIGYNGVYFHHNVVRKLLPQAQGTLLKGGQQAGTQGTLDLSSLEDDLKAYLEETEEAKKQQFSEFLHKMDRQDLHLVAFLQDEQSGRIHQAAMVKVETKAPQAELSQPR
ncbi:MAG TPA: tetratricopeptide repeat protein [Acidobacteriota bacterium]|nr:tetratricopeptide repeat protein [Acidobacteriota bacterium]